MSDETLRILKLLEAGKISSKEAEDLLSAIQSGNGAGDDGFGFRHDFHHRRQFGDQHPGRIMAEVMREVNPGKIVAEAMESVRESMQDVDGICVPRPPKPPKPPRPPRMHGFQIFTDEIFGRESAEDTQHLSVPAEGITALSLNQPRSEIKVRAAQGSEITIDAEIEVWADDEDEARERLKSVKVATENENGVLHVKVDGPPWTKKRRAKVDFVISLPETIALELGTASGEVEVAGMAAGIRINTASGEVTIEGCRNLVEVSTASGEIGLSGCQSLQASLNSASGDVQIEDCQGSASIQTVSGDVEAVLDGDLVCSTVSGDIDADAVNAAAVKIGSTSGDIELNASLQPDSKTSITSISGDISLSLADGTGADIEAGTTSGDIDCELELTDLRQRNRSLTGRLGGGGSAISLKTTSGDILIS